MKVQDRSLPATGRRLNLFNYVSVKEFATGKFFRKNNPQDVDYSCPFQQYVQSLQWSSPVLSSMSSRRWYLRVVKCSIVLIASTIFSYFGLSGSQYSLRTSSLTFSPSNCLTTRRAIKSISDFERLKLRYLHPNMIGGHAGRT